MPKDGLQERSTSASARRTESAAARLSTAPSHRPTDALGVGFIAVSLILVVGLALGNAGVLGDGLAGLFRTLFGSGAWAVPVVAGLTGFLLLAGRARAQTSRVTWGTLLIFLAVVGVLARSVQGDYFDPVTAAGSGGYVGAVVAWLFSTLFGAGMLIGLAAVFLLGLVLCIDAPLRNLVAALANRDRGRRLDAAIERAQRPAESTRRAAVRIPVDDDEPGVAEPSPVTKEAPTRRRSAPVVHDTLSPVTLDITDGGAPREGYTLPPMNLLQEPVQRAKRNPQEVQKNIETLESTLDEFGIDANVVEVATGPTITRYEIQLGPGIRVNRITALADNIAMNLAASHVRVEAPIPGKSAIGVEVPTGVRATVTLREMCETLEFHQTDSKLTVALGKDVAGVNKYTDLTKMPHLLIGGATNSGKSICLASLIMSLIIRNTPKDLRLVMIDPKRVELSLFEGLPHLMCPVVKDVKEAPGVLRAVWREMDRRYDKFSEAGVRNIDGWNAKADFQDKLPYIVVIVDELADLMIQAAAEVETSICRLAQLARATGIHLVIATQRPSVDVITGTIKANIASRIAFAVSSQIDSRTILDQAGAERLIGKGDMLFLPIDQTKPLRVQGCYVSEKEIEDVCTFWRQQEKPQYVLNPVQLAIEERESEMREQEDADPLWDDAVRWVVERGQASTSMLQRRFSIGFQRASRLLDLMEERGIVGPRDGPRPREVLLDPMQYETRFGDRKYADPVPEDEILDWDES